MLILLAFAFIAGLVTILSPCILPLLPIILAGGTGGNKHRPLGIITGFVGSFTLFTLLLSMIVKSTGVSADALRQLAAATLAAFGLSLVIPQIQSAWERFSSRLASSSNSQSRPGYTGGLLVGLSLGLVWTPCVGPILASVITLAATSTVTLETFLITLSYSFGTALPLFLIMRGSSFVTSRFTWLKENSHTIQRVFGLMMLATALLIFFQLDRRFQSYILDKFPNYGAGLTQLENNSLVSDSLTTLHKQGGNMSSVKLSNKGQAPELTGGQSWLNSDPLTLAELRGQVVLVDFWTYSCVNCIRTLPYLRAWHDKYSDKGLVIVGIHSPEFEFEKSLDNLTRAAKDFELKYPIVQDNDFNIWRAYNNHYWPAKYLIDKEGVIRYAHFGEGKYDETERVIQELLGESTDLVDMPEYEHESRSPETYLGYWRIANVVSSPSISHGNLVTYTSPDSFPTNGIGFRGAWTVYEKHATPKPGSSLLFRFDAKEVNLVMRPTSGKITPAIEVFLDGKLVQTLTITSDQLYNLIKLESGENHTIEIKYPEGNVEVYAFTFG